MNYFKRYIKSRLFGGDVKRLISSNKIPDQAVSLNRLKQLGFNPKSIFDIGAYQGDFTETCLKVWPNSEVIAFEALNEKVEILKNKFKNHKVKIVEGIIGETDSTNVPFFSDETASSVLASEEVYHSKKIIKQRMLSLDRFIQESATGAPNFLKIDTQGYEFQILKGCQKSLHLIDVLLLEVNFLEVYNDVKLAHQVIALLNEFGFVIYDICEIHRRPLDNALFQIDFLFVKNDSTLRADKKWDHKII